MTTEHLGNHCGVYVSVETITHGPTGQRLFTTRGVVRGERDPRPFDDSEGRYYTPLQLRALAAVLVLAAQTIERADRNEERPAGDVQPWATLKDRP